MNWQISILFLVLLFCRPGLCISQDNQGASFNPHDKGALLLYLGCNRSAYTRSNIHFEGSGYRFELEDVINTSHLPDRAKREFWFFEHQLSIGATIPINVDK